MKPAAVTAVVLVFTSVSSLPLLIAETLPPYIKPCYRDDPKLNECALRNAKDAIPFLIKGDTKYGIPLLEPLEVNGISVKEKDGLGIAFSCDKCQFHNLNNINLRAVRFDPRKQHIELEGSVARLDIKGKYHASGVVLVLPIQGQGDADLTLKNLDLLYKADYDLIKKGTDGKEYIKLKNPKITFKAKKLIINLTNLFRGDKALGTAMNRFLNQNWREVLRVFGPSVADSVTGVVSTIVNGIAEKVPYDEVLPLSPSPFPPQSANPHHSNLRP